MVLNTNIQCFISTVSEIMSTGTGRVPIPEGFKALWRWYLGTGSLVALAVLGILGFNLGGLF